MTNAEYVESVRADQAKLELRIAASQFLIDGLRDAGASVDEAQAELDSIRAEFESAQRSLAMFARGVEEGNPGLIMSALQALRGGAS
jgi:hypothetical protein